MTPFLLRVHISESIKSKFRILYIILDHFNFVLTHSCARIILFSTIFGSFRFIFWGFAELYLVLYPQCLMCKQITHQCNLNIPFSFCYILEIISSCFILKRHIILQTYEKLYLWKNCFPDFYVFDSKKCRSSHTDFIYLRGKMANKRIYWAKMNLPQKLIRTHTWFLLVTAASKRSLCGRGKVCFSSVGELLQNNEHNHNIAHQTLASLLIHT